MRIVNSILILLVLQFSTLSSTAQETNNSPSADSSGAIKVDSVTTTATEMGGYSFHLSPSFDVFYAIIIIILAFVFIVYLRQPLQKLSERRIGISRFLKQFISICMIIFGFLILHFVTTEVLHLSTILTVTLVFLIGLALIVGFQDSIKDLIAGLLIPFETYIEKGYKIDTGEIQGEIMRIGMREIEIKTYDGKQAIIPSHSFLKKPLSSIYTEKENYPIKVDFYLESTVDFDKCREIAYKSTIVSPYLYLNKPVDIFFENVISNDHVLTKMSVEAFLQKIDFHQKFCSELTQTVNRELNNTSIFTNSR